MKKIFLLAVLIPLFIAEAISQSSNRGYLGIDVKPARDRQYLDINRVIMGWPAELYGLQDGYRICSIDDRPVKEYPDPVQALLGEAGTSVKISGIRLGADSVFTVRVPRISVPPDDNNLSEGHLAAMLYTEGQVRYMNKAGISVLNDDEADMMRYKSFDFDYTDAADPLLEKEIFRILEKRMLQKGLVRDREHPDILILMKSFAGQKEQYIPPEQIISTRVQTIYNWRWGLVPMPITESQTRAGYTEVTYLYSISLKFLDAQKISSSELPPVLWSASFSEASGKKSALLDKADYYFAWMLYLYPYAWMNNANYYVGIPYAWTGIIYDRKDLNRIAEVIPGSPADKAGLKKGDQVISVMDEKIKGDFDNMKDGRWLNVVAKWGKLTGFRYLYMYGGASRYSGGGETYIPYKGGTPEELVFRVESGGRKSDLKIRPEKRYYFNYFNAR